MLLQNMIRKMQENKKLKQNCPIDVYIPENHYFRFILLMANPHESH